VHYKTKTFKCSIVFEETGGKDTKQCVEKNEARGEKEIYNS